MFQDLINGAAEGEKKKDLAMAKLDSLKALLPKQKQAELEKQKKQTEAEWKQLAKYMNNTQ